jgi:hypothetical protein
MEPAIRSQGLVPARGAKSVTKSQIAKLLSALLCSNGAMAPLSTGKEGTKDDFRVFA